MISVPVWIVFVFWYVFGACSGVAGVLAALVWAKRKIDAAAAAAWQRDVAASASVGKVGGSNE